MTTEDTVYEEATESPNQTLALITEARHALAEAKTLPDFRRLMEAAAVYADMAQRQAKLMEAQGVAAEVVAQANDAANDAAAVRIEAQAGAGRILIEMAETGQRTKPGGWRKRKKAVDGAEEEVNLASPSLPTLEELVGTSSTRQGAHQQASRWQRVAEIPDNVRVEYVDKMRDESGEITTAGLLRYAAEPKPEPEPKEAMAQIYGEVAKALATIVQYDPITVAGYAANSRKKGKFKALASATKSWLAKIDSVYSVGSDDEDTE